MLSGSRNNFRTHMLSPWPTRLVPCKGIRNPESNIFLPLESGIQGFRIRNPTHGIRNPTSSITLESRSGMYWLLVIIPWLLSNFIKNHHLPPPLGVPYHHRHQRVFGHLTCTSNMSTLRLGGFWFLIGHMFHCSDMPSDLNPHCLLNGRHSSQLFSFMLGFTSSYI